MAPLTSSSSSNGPLPSPPRPINTTGIGVEKYPILHVLLLQFFSAFSFTCSSSRSISKVKTLLKFIHLSYPTLQFQVELKGIWNFGLEFFLEYLVKVRFNLFFIPESQNSLENENADANVVCSNEIPDQIECSNDVLVNVDASNAECLNEVPVSVDAECLDNINENPAASNVNHNTVNLMGIQIDDNEHPNSVDSLENDNVNPNNSADIHNVDFDDVNASFDRPDIYDPRVWDALSSEMIDVLFVKGPKRDLSIQKGPKDNHFRRFSATCYTRILSNGEKCDREWLIYSKEIDKIFCFCCKIFKKGSVKGQLVNEGFGDWSHLSTRLKEHETSMEHVKNMTTWYDLRLRLQKNQTIDKVVQKQLEKERNHWRKVLVRVVSVVKYLAKHNLAFRGSNGRLYQDSNGNFLGLIEMLAEFDLIVQEHVQRITNEEIHAHYLGHTVQNELILLIASKIKSEIIRRVKKVKYFSIILDCTPDISHQEQMSLILRYVNMDSMSIEESFLGFLQVNDTIGQGLFDALQLELNLLDLDIDNVRGQSYDNGSNMKGNHQGVQRKLLDLNPRAFHTSYASHSLNLMLCDIANTCGKARDFFGIIQRIYTIFANSTKRWQIFKDNVKGLTLKSLSTTRWKSRIDSVKPIRFQVLEIREALLEVSESDNDSKIRSEAKSLAQNELGDYEFLVSIVIWYEILYVVHLVSKNLQSEEMLIDVAIESVKGLISFFKGYRENGFEKALETAKEIAIENNIDPVFRQKRVIRRKKHFDEQSGDSFVIEDSAQELFRKHYFLCIIDDSIGSLERRFEQYQDYESIFGFLFTSKVLRSLDDVSLKYSCGRVEDALKNQEQSDINGNELYIELKLLQDCLSRDHVMGAIDILRYLKRVDCFPNAIIVYRILLTIPVTVASAERSFSKLKLLKSYLRSTMTQERLNGLALIAIENNIMEKVNYEELIEEFVSKNVRRKTVFN